MFYVCLLFVFVAGVQIVCSILFTKEVNLYKMLLVHFGSFMLLMSFF